jgi:hypothetical protein
MISIPRVPVRRAKWHRLPACIESPTSFAFVSRRSGAIVLEPKREPTVVDARNRLEAYATLRRRGSTWVRGGASAG